MTRVDELRTRDSLTAKSRWLAAFWVAKLRVSALWISALWVSALCVGCGADLRDATQDQIRSVLLITIDTLRADHLSGYGYAHPTSPELDRFMDRGQRFRWAFSTSSRTAPSHVSILTGLYPSATTVSVENGKYALDAGTATLATLAGRAGIRTAAIVSNPVLNRRLGLDRGFEVYDDAMPEREKNRSSRERTSEHAVDAAIAQLDAFGTERFFVWLHVQDPHGPYTPPEAAVEALPMASELPLESALPLESDVAAPTRRLPPGQNHSGYRAIPRYQYLGSQLQLSDYIRLYDAEIRHLDESLGRLFRYLEGEGRARDTLVAITADHGEAFGEDDYFCAHGHGIGIDQTRVPLAFVGPGIAPGGVLSTPVSNIDLFATLLEALGELEGPPVDSASLLRNLREGTEPKGRLGYAESVTQRAVISNGLYFRRDVRALDDHDFWKSSNPYTGALYRPLKSLRFTSLKKDVTVERSAANAKQLPKRTKSLAVSLDAFESRVAAMESKLAATRENADSGALTDEEEEELRELGYLE